MARKEQARNKSFSVEDLLRENEGLRNELAKLESYRTLAYRDDLTDLWNRRYFSERLTEEISRARRRPQRHFTIMMVDVNDLKALNDSYGHQEGDLVLRWVAEFLGRSLRAHDVICRVGGDEFAVLLPEIGAEPAAALLARLRATLAATRTGAPYTIALSFGLAAYPHDGKTCDELVHVADDQMYRDKQRQKDAPSGAPMAGPKRASVRS